MPGATTSVSPTMMGTNTSSATTSPMPMPAATHSAQFPVGSFLCLRIATHIAVRVLTRPIPLHGIRREEHPGHLVIIARAIVIQPGQAVVVLPGEALGGVDRPLVIAEVAVGSKHLVALDAAVLVTLLKLASTLPSASVR